MNPRLAGIRPLLAFAIGALALLGAFGIGVVVGDGLSDTAATSTRPPAAVTTSTTAAPQPTTRSDRITPTPAKPRPRRSDQARESGPPVISEGGGPPIISEGGGED